VTLFIEFVPLGVKGPRSKLRRLKILYLDGSAEKAIATLLLLFSEKINHFQENIENNK
jgi:hypothetical protein